MFRTSFFLCFVFFASVLSVDKAPLTESETILASSATNQQGTKEKPKQNAPVLPTGPVAENSEEAKFLTLIKQNVAKYAGRHFHSSDLKVPSASFNDPQEIEKTTKTRSSSPIPELHVSESQIVYLPYEVVLIKSAIPSSRQSELYSQFVPSIPSTEKTTQQTDMCSGQRCTLFTWRDSQQSEYARYLGKSLFRVMNNRLQRFQQVKTSGTIHSELVAEPSLDTEFNWIHGVLFSINGSLSMHRDKTHDGRRSDGTEWVVSLSLGHAADFTFTFGDEPASSIRLESGDALLFNGGQLYHGVTRIIPNSAPTWWASVETYGKARFNLQYRLLPRSSRWEVPTDNHENAWLMRIQDQRVAADQTGWLMRIQDQPVAADETKWLMRIQDQPVAADETKWLMRIQDQPVAAEETAWLMRIQDQPVAADQTGWLMRIQDQPVAAEETAWLMRIQDQPVAAEETAWLMRIQDQPVAAEETAWLMRIQDQPIAEQNKRFRRSHNQPVADENRWLMRIEDLHQPNLLFLGNEWLAQAGFLQGGKPDFWPFDPAIIRYNQQLFLRATSKGPITSEPDLKTEFFSKLFTKDFSFPVNSKVINVVFENAATLSAVMSASLVKYSKQFLVEGRHLFSNSERAKIEVLVTDALKLINQTDSQIYECIRSAVGSIAMFKAEEQGYLGGTVSGAIGLVWLDPSAGKEWTVEAMAEQIVHEFIHTALFTAELVHSMYRDASLVPRTLVKSAIRQQLRGYDKAIHAAYVSTGLVIFHSKAGHHQRAQELFRNLSEAITDLQKVQTRTSILNSSGQSMLQHLSEVMHRSLQH